MSLWQRFCPSPSVQPRRLRPALLEGHFLHILLLLPTFSWEPPHGKDPTNSRVPLPGGRRAGHRLGVSRKAPWLLFGLWQSPAWLCSGTFAVDPTSFVFKLHSGLKVRNLLVGLFFCFVLFSLPLDKLKDPKEEMNWESSWVVPRAVLGYYGIIWEQDCDQVWAHNDFSVLKCFLLAQNKPGGPGYSTGVLPCSSAVTLGIW